MDEPLNAQINVLLDYPGFGEDYLAAIERLGVDRANDEIVKACFLDSAVGQLVIVQDIPFRVVSGTDSVALSVTEEQRLALKLALSEGQVIRRDIVTAEHYLPAAPFRRA